MDIDRNVRRQPIKNKGRRETSRQERNRRRPGTLSRGKESWPEQGIVYVVAIVRIGGIGETESDVRDNLSGNPIGNRIVRDVEEVAASSHASYKIKSGRILREQADAQPRIHTCAKQCFGTRRTSQRGSLGKKRTETGVPSQHPVDIHLESRSRQQIDPKQRDVRSGGIVDGKKKIRPSEEPGEGIVHERMPGYIHPQGIGPGIRAKGSIKDMLILERSGHPVLSGENGHGNNDE